MKLRLHEIELGSGDVQNSTASFVSLPGLKPALEKEGLTVLQAGLPGLDLNLSTHFSQGAVCLSFLTDDLLQAEAVLKAGGQAYRGPQPSHLGMHCLEFSSPGGHASG